MPISKKRARSPNGILAPAAKQSKTTKKQPNKKPARADTDSEDGSDSDSASESKSESMSELDRDKLGVDPGDCKIAGRAIARCCDMFCNVKTSINTVMYVKEDEAAENDSESEDEETSLQRRQFLSKMSDETIARHKRTYALLIRLVPGIKVLIENSSHSAKLKKVIKLVNGIIGETRANDAARLKDKILSYIVHNPAVDQLSPPIPPGSSRSTMGLNHIVLAGLLCPVESAATFYENPEVTRKMLESGKIDMFSTDFPSFLWEDNGRQFDNKKMIKGLLRGYFLERVTRHIFTGPSTGLGGDSLGTRPSNSDLHHMDKTEAAQIAYAAVQARWGISSKTRWSEQDGNFNYREFYYSIIDIINSCKDVSWKDGILKHYNLMLFKDEKGRRVNFAEKNDDNGSTKSGSFLDRLREQTADTPDAESEGPGPGFGSNDVVMAPPGPVAAAPQSLPAESTSDEPHAVQPKSPLPSIGRPIQSVFSPTRQSFPAPVSEPRPCGRAATPSRMGTPPSDLTDLEMDENRPTSPNSKAKSKPVRAQKKGKKKSGTVLDSNDEAASSSHSQRKNTRRKGRK